MSLFKFRWFSLVFYVCGFRFSIEPVVRLRILSEGEAVLWHDAERNRTWGDIVGGNPYANSIKLI